MWFIDNDLAYRFLLRCELELNPIGGKLRMFDDGDRALMKLIEICTKNKAMLPKAIFTNIDTNRVGGWELVQTLKEFELNVDVVLFSTHPRSSDNDRMLREPLVRDILVKHHDPGNIIEKMKHFASKGDC